MDCNRRSNFFSLAPSRHGAGRRHIVQIKALRPLGQWERQDVPAFAVFSVLREARGEAGWPVGERSHAESVVCSGSDRVKPQSLNETSSFTHEGGTTPA